MYQLFEDYTGLEPWLVGGRISAFFETGGLVMIVLAGMSVLALTVIIFKFLQFGYYELWRKAFLQDALGAWQLRDSARTLAILAGTRNPIARTMELAVWGKRDGIMARRDLEDDTARDAAGHVAKLRRCLGLLELIATLAPLLGLLGTVLGMIDAFQALEAAGNRVDPSILSGGIWVALLTTAAGLIVAIPAAAAHNILQGVVERVTQSLEDAVTQILVSSTSGKPARPDKDTGYGYPAAEMTS